MRVTVKPEPGDATRLPEDWNIPESLRTPPDTPEEVVKDAEEAVRGYESERHWRITKRKGRNRKHGSHGGGD